MSRIFRTDIENNGKVDHLSKPILRTNPKISSNIKVVVEDNNMYLESFDASTELADSKFKKYVIKPSGDYSYDVSAFWSLNNTPLELAYHVKKNHSDFEVLDSYDKQFEKTYIYGASTNFSKLHDYSLKILAPIWLDKNIPSKFLIYRISRPLDSGITDSSTSLERINGMLKNSTLIKTIDLSENSNIGKYIRKHVEHPEFPSSPIDASFNKEDQTFYNGIDLIKGGFTSKGEFHYKDTVLTDKPLIEYNQFITDGFSRNSMVCANLMNLEFLFDDEMAEEFSINRYFGIFVDDYELGEGQVEKIEKKSSSDPVFDKIKFSSISQSLDSTLSQDWMALPYSDWYKNNTMLGWVKAFSNYHNIKNGANWDSSNYEIGIDANGLDYSDFIGIKKSSRSINVIENENSGSDFIKVEVTDIPNDGNTFTLVTLKRQRWVFRVTSFSTTGNIKIEDGNTNGVSVSVSATSNEQSILLDIKSQIDNTGTGNWLKYDTLVQQDSSGEWVLELTEKDFNMEENHDFIQVINNGGNIKIKRTYSPTEVIKNTFEATSSLPAGRISGNLFSNQGSLDNIAFAIHTIIKENTLFDSEINGTVFYVKSPSKGYRKYNCGLFLLNTNNTFLNLPNLDTTNNLDVSSTYLNFYDAYYLSGGNDANKSVFIEENEVGNVSIGEYLLGQDSLYNEIIDIVDDARTADSTLKKLVLNLKNSEIKNLQNIYVDFKLKWGMFSAYDIYDLNFDFYDETNSLWNELEGEEETSYDESVLFPGFGWTTNVDSIYPLNPLANSGQLYTWQNPKISPYGEPLNLNQTNNDYFSKLLDLLFDEDSNDNLLESVTINSEYERLQENNTTEFSTTSRTVPFINKWVLKDSVNTRENPYYLNVNEAFGETNFSPDFNKDRDPQGLTHEWFYLENYPPYIGPKDISKSYSYINPLLNGQITFDMFKDINVNYFDLSFISNGAFVQSSNGNAIFSQKNIQKKYSLIKEGSTLTDAYTIFRGIKFIPKLRKKIATTIEDNFTKEFVKGTSFNGYKFSAILKTTFDNTFGNSLKVKVCKNEKWKSMVLFLEVNLSEDPVAGINFLNRKLLYELTNKINVSILPGNVLDTSYGDNIVDGAIDLSTSTGVILTAGTLTTLPAFQNLLTLENPALLSQIERNPVDGTFGRLKITIGGIDYYLQVSDVGSNSSITVVGQLLDSNGNVQNPGFYTSNQWLTAEYVYEGGGINAHKTLLEKLSIKNIKSLLERNEDIEYVTIKKDGTVVNQEFILCVEEGVEVIKKSNLFVEIDENKPKSFGLSNDTIGYSIEERPEYYAFLNRHNGQYTVDMNPVITFREPFSFHKIDTDYLTEHYSSQFYPYDLSDPVLNEMSIALYKKFNNCGVAFNVGVVKDEQYTDDSFGYIKNHFFHKVNEISTDGVIKLSESSDLLPKYNLVNEIAIDKKDYNVFKSRWEEDFYLRASEKGKFKKVPGTKNIVEEKTYASSSVMKLGSGYDIFNFTIGQFETIEELNEIRVLRNSEFEINFIETEDQIFIDFYLTDSATRELSSLGVNNEIAQYVLPENSFGKLDTLEDDVNGYIVNNVLPLYKIKSIDLYVKEARKQAASHLSVVESTSTLNSIDDGGYEIKNEFTYKLDSKNPLDLRLIYNKRKGFVYNIRPLIKIQS